MLTKQPGPILVPETGCRHLFADRAMRMMTRDPDRVSHAFGRRAAINGVETAFKRDFGCVGQQVDSRLIVDTMNMIGRCVVAGGIRGSTQIVFGDAYSNL